MEFNSEDDTFDLRAVRTYEYDRRLMDFNGMKKTRRKNRGPSVREMMKKAGVG